jgi:hypothetical protein
MKTYEWRCFKSFVNDDDFLEVTVWGNWEQADVEAFSEALKSGLKYLGDKGKPKLILYDARKLKILSFADTRTRGNLVQVIEGLDFDELIDFGVSDILASVARLLGSVNKNMARVRLFKDRDQAVEFLKKRQAELLNPTAAH